MRYEKRLSLPAAVHKRVRLPLASWKKYGLVLNHLRVENDALVLAEGAEFAFTSDVQAEFLFSSESELVSYFPRLNRLRCFFREKGRLFQNFCEIADYVTETGERILYILGEHSLCYDDGEKVSAYSGVPGGHTMAVHKDRLFFAATDGKLYWSCAYPQSGFATTGTQESGSLDLVDESLGGIVRLISLGNVLVIFHERGVSRLAGSADTMTFRLEKLAFDCSSVNGRSVAKCNGKIFFFTEKDLFVTDGVSVKRVKNTVAEEIDLRETIYGGVAYGNYYASVQRQDGTRQIYCYDDSFACGRFLALQNVSIAGMRGIYRLNAGKVDLLGGSAPPEIGEASAVFRYQLYDGAEGENAFESVEVEGRGMYEVCITANGVTRHVRGSAGKRLPLNGALRANEVTVEIKPFDSDFALRGVVLYERREAVL